MMSTRPVISYPVLLSLLAALVIILTLGSLMVGYIPISMIDAYSMDVWRDDNELSVILREIRLPRAILGAMVGATMGLSGAALQGLLRNPLAEPGIIGVSTSASLGAVIVMYYGLSLSFPLALPIAGIVGALIAVVLLYIIGGRTSSITTLILAGIALNSFAGALSSLALNLSPNPYAALEIAFWMLGSLVDRSNDQLTLAAPLMILGWVFLLSAGRALDALTLGEETAKSLGFNLDAVRFRLIIGTALSVGAAVAVSGVIGFVGLVIPHLLRPLVQYRPSLLLPASALGGAVLVLAADIIVRLVPTQPEIKLGVVTALIGAPFFLHLVLRHRRGQL